MPAGAHSEAKNHPTSQARSKLAKYRAIPSVKVGKAEIGGKQVRIPGRLLMAEDEFFKAIGYRQEINAQAFRLAANEGLKGKALAKRVAELKANPTDEMAKAARLSRREADLHKPARQLRAAAHGDDARGSCLACRDAVHSDACEHRQVCG